MEGKQGGMWSRNPTILVTSYVNDFLGLVGHIAVISTQLVDSQTNAQKQRKRSLQEESIKSAIAPE